MLAIFEELLLFRETTFEVRGTSWHVRGLRSGGRASSTASVRLLIRSFRLSNDGDVGKTDEDAINEVCQLVLLLELVHRMIVLHFYVSTELDWKDQLMHDSSNCIDCELPEPEGQLFN